MAMGTTVQISEDGDKLLVSLPPQLTIATATACFTEVCAALAKSGKKELLLSADRVTAWDPTGLAVIRALRRWCLKRDLEWDVSGGDPTLIEGVQAAAHDLSYTITMAGPVMPSLPEVVADRTINYLREAYRQVVFLGDVFLGGVSSLLHPRKIRWRDTIYYMDRCGTDALPIVVLICFLMGLILGFLAALQLHQFGADSFVADLVGLSIVRELGPLMVAMICTGRAGSAFAAEIGTMKVAEEVDALVTMGLEPTRFLIMPKMIALAVVMPILTIFGDLMGVFGGFVVGVVQLGLPPVSYLSRTTEAIAAMDVTQSLIKSLVFAILVAGVGCLRGLEARNSAQDVGRSTTSAVVSGIFLVIVADTLLAYLFAVLTT